MSLFSTYDDKFADMRTKKRSDLIERLRPNPDDYNQKLRMEAADEIERLTNVLEYARNEIRDGNKRIADLEAKIERLNALEHLSKWVHLELLQEALENNDE